MKQKRLIYLYPNPSTFVRRDVELLSHRYTVIPFNLNQGNPLKLPWQLIRQKLFLLKHLFRTDAVICHFAGYSSLLPVLFSRLFHKPCLIIIAGTDAACFPAYHYGNFVKKANALATSISLRKATHLLPVHESLVFQHYTYDPAGEPAQGYTVFAPSSAKTPWTAVYYGYDDQFFRPVDGIARKPLSFITVGNLAQKTLFVRKGYDLILELAERRPELQFTLVGSSGSTRWDVPPNVQVLPYMDQHQIREAFSAHEFYFQLSVMEGFPNALCEAMLCGCIPIGSNVSAIPFIIGDSGFVLEKRNVEALDQLIEKIIQTPDRELLSKKARERIASNFTYQRRLEELSEIIERYTS